MFSSRSIYCSSLNCDLEVNTANESFSSLLSHRLRPFFPSPALTAHSFPFPSSPIPYSLEAGCFNPSRGLGSCKLPAWSGPKLHFSLKVCMTSGGNSFNDFPEMSSRLNSKRKLGPSIRSKFAKVDRCLHTAIYLRQRRQRYCRD